MGYQRLQQSRAGLWALARSQHGVVTRAQLLALGFSSQAIKRRTSNGRLHPVSRGIYAVGRPEITRYGRWMAAVLSCGSEAVLSHRSAAALWEISAERVNRIEVSVPGRTVRRRPGIVVHRCGTLAVSDVTRRHGPVTTPVRTLIDLATCLSRERLETAINEADKRQLTNPDAVRLSVEAAVGTRGAAVLRQLLDLRTFVLTDSELERRFLPIASDAGLPLPKTGPYVSGFRVDFYWPDLGLVVETDGLRYHRTPAQQARDRVRDQAHIAAGLTQLRFTHGQVRFEPDYVRAMLIAVANRLRGTPARR